MPIKLTELLKGEARFPRVPTQAAWEKKKTITLGAGLWLKGDDLGGASRSGKKLTRRCARRLHSCTGIPICSATRSSISDWRITEWGI
jgi:hypothetical protein